MGSEESIKDEYGFIRYSTSSTNPSREESPTYSSPVYGRSSAPDHRRFAIALSELPALNFYNPLLNNPSSSEYIASVRSSIRSINEIGSAQFNPHPRLVRNSVPSTTLTSVPPYWSQDSVKSIQSSNESDSVKKPISFSSNFNCAFINKSFLGFCVSVWIVLFLGVAAAALLYFTTKGGLLFHPFNPPTANIVYGEFHIVNRINSSEIPGENGTITNLANQLQEKMDDMFQSSALLSTLYNRSVLFGIVAGSTHSERPSPVIYIQFKIHLNHADVMIAEKMAHVLASNLHPKEDHLDLFENWAINISTIKFAEIIPSRLKDSQSKRLASWGMWTEWTPECYLTSCNLSRTQSRNRRCLLRDRNPEEIVEESSTNRPVNFVTSCIAGSTVSAADVEIRPCNCVARSRFPRPRIPFTVVRPTKASHFRFSNTSIAAFEETCSQCRRGEVCVARLEEVVPVCRWAPDAEDPTGCGGFCRANTEYCVSLGSNSFKCEGTSECLADSEWRCRDGFCIHNLKRCDGDYNCYDQSDELDCVKETKN